MTTPIDWLPVPIPSRQAIDDLPTPGNDQAVAIDGNLVKVNNFLRDRPQSATSTYTRQTGSFNGTLTATGAFGQFNPALWPITSFVVPDCYGALVYAGGSIYNGPPNSCIAIGAQVGGAGCPTNVLVPHYSAMSQWEAGGYTMFVSASNFVVGAVATLTPMTFCWVTGNYLIDSCEIGVQFLS